jgi:hypothetical protein
MDTENRGTVARPARTLWQVGFIVATRFYRWQKAKIWNQVLESLQAEADKLLKARLAGSLCRWQRDSCPPTCGWWEKGGEQDEKLGRSRGGFSTKIHIRCEGKGRPITFLLSLLSA